MIDLLTNQPPSNRKRFPEFHLWLALNLAYVRKLMNYFTRFNSCREQSTSYMYYILLGRTVMQAMQRIMELIGSPTHY